MIARIGIADTSRELEITIESRDAFVQQVESAYADGQAMIWVSEVKGSEVGIPVARIGYIEIAGDAGQSVGFSR